MSSLKESVGPATRGTPTNSLTADSTSTQAVDVVNGSTPDNVLPMGPQPGSVAAESGLFEEKFDSLKSSRGDGSLTGPGNECRSMASVATNSQAGRDRPEGGLRPGSFESITESHRIVAGPYPLGPYAAEVSPKKKRRKRSASPLAVSPDLRGAADLAGISALLEAVPPVSEHFEVLSKIGEGTFSAVFLARLKVDGEEGSCFALKHIVPTSAPCRMENELRCLQVMGGCAHVVPLETCIRHRDHVVLVMPYVKHDKFADYLPFMTVEETRGYMRALFQALSHVHSFCVIHRDIKPGNFLYNRKEKSFYLVDFGLAHLESGRTGEFRGSSILSTSSKNHTHAHARPKQQLTEIRRSPRLAGGAGKSRVFATPQHPSTSPSTQGLASQSHSGSKANSTILQTQFGGKRGPSLDSIISGDGDQRGGDVDGKSMRAKIVTPQGRGVTADRQGYCNGRQVKVAARDPPDVTAQQKPMRLSMSVGAKKSTVDSVPRGRRSLSASRHRREGCDLEHREMEVCDICMARQSQNTPRAGTPGFRAPEVLLKSPQQTTAVDLWSVGVILLCILSGRYPFFRAQDDMTALIQIMRLMGTAACKDAAKALGKELVCKPEVQATDLKLLCQQLRSSLPNEKKKLQQGGSDDETRPNNSSTHTPVCNGGGETPLPSKTASLSCRCKEHNTETNSGAPVSLLTAPNSIYDLLHRLLQLDPARRITADEALQHPFITDK